VINDYLLPNLENLYIRAHKCGRSESEAEDQSLRDLKRRKNGDSGVPKRKFGVPNRLIMQTRSR